MNTERKPRRESIAHVPEVQQTIVELEQWRAIRPRGTRIPPELKQRAFRFAETYGIPRVCRALKLHARQFKEPLKPCERGTDLEPQRKIDEQTFVSIAPFLSAPLATSLITCVVEVNDALGAKMSMTFTGATPDVDTMLRAFWRRP